MDHTKYIIFGFIAVTLFISGCAGEDPWNIDGDSVYIDNSYLYMNVTPHTISNSDWVELEFESKVFSGDIDFVFGFNTTDGVYPTEADRWNPHIENVTINYTCLHEFNYTTNPNHFWCYYAEGGLIFDHFFEGGNVGEKTAWWTELQENNWTDWQPENSVEYDFLGMDKWYYTTGQPIVAEQNYKIRYHLEMPMDASGKYTLAIKPSSETIEEAIANEHLWYLDPWYDYSSLDTNLVAYYSFDNGDLVGDKTGNGYNLTIDTANNPLLRGAGILNQSYANDEASANADFLYTLEPINYGTAFSISMWMNYTDQGLQTYPFGNSTNLNLLCNKDNGQIWVYNGASVKLQAGNGVNCEQAGWRHWVITYDGVTMRAYFGNSTGMYNDSSAVADNFGTVTGTYIFAHNPTRGNDAWEDGIDEVGIWNKTLSADEVGYLWNSGAGLYYNPPGPSANLTVWNHTIYPSTAYYNSTLNCSARVVTNYATLHNITFNWTNSSGFVQQTEFTEVANNTYSSTNQTVANPLVSTDVWNCTVDVTEVANASVFNITSTTKTISSYPPVWVDRPTNITKYNSDNFTLDFNCTNPEGSPSYYIRNLTRNLDNPITINSSNGLIEVDPTYNDTQTFNYNVTCLYGSNNLTSILNVSINQSAVYTQSVLYSPISEGNNQTFYLNLGLTNNSLTPTAPTLNYNGSTYAVTTTASGTSGNTNFWNWTTILALPNATGSTTGLNKTYNWTIPITTFLEGFETNSSNFTLFAGAIDDCSAYGDVILNLTLRDEGNYTVEYGDIEVDLDISSWSNSSILWTFNKTWTNVTTATVCVPAGFLTGSSYALNYTFQYDSTNRVTEFSFMDNGNLSSLQTFNSYTQRNQSLLDLALADSTTFLLSYLNADGLSLDNIIIITYRKYVGEGLFREAERSRESDTGVTDTHLVEEDVIYYFVVTQNGNILYTSSQSQALCTTDPPCTITLTDSDEFQGIPTDYDEIDDGWYTVTSDSNSRQATLTFSADNTSVWNFTIYRYGNNISEVTVQNSSFLNASSGSITLGVPLTAGNITFVGRVHREGDFIVDRFLDMTGDYLDEFRLSGGIILAGIVVLTLGLMAVTEGAILIVMFVAGTVFVGLLGLVEQNWYAFILMAVMGGLLFWKLKNR